jgi:adenylate cyclase
VDERIVILDIDEKSLATPGLGQWPWGRDVVAGLVAKLFDKYGVAILGFDVVFAEPDRSSGLRVLDGLAKGPLKDVPDFQAALAELRPRLDHDAQFVQTIKGRPVVLGYYLTSDRDARTNGTLPPPVLEPGTFANRPIEFTSWTGCSTNLPAAFQGRRRRPGIARSPTRTASTGGCRCSPNTRARTTSRCRSR